MKSLQYAAALFICVFVCAFGFSAPKARASDCSTTGTSTAWSNPASWSGGCSGVGGIPGAGDEVDIFNPITLDMNTPALGTMYVYDTFNTSTSNYSITANVILIEFSGVFTANASTVTITSTAGGTPLLNVGTFNQGTSTVVYTADVDIFIAGTSSSVAYYNLTLAPSPSGTRTYTMNAMVVGNNFTIAPTSANAFHATLAGNLSVTGTTSISASGSASGVLDTSGSNYLFTTAKINIGAGGTFNAEGSTVTVDGTSGTLFTLGAGGTFNAGTSIVNISGGGSTTLNSGSPTFYALLSSGSGTKTLGAPLTATSTLTISSGTFDTSTSNYTLTIGSLSISSGATLTCNASTINVTGTSGTLITTALSGTPISYGTSTFNFSGNGNATIVGSLQVDFYNVISSGTGTKTAGSGGMVMRTGGTLSVTNGTFDSGGNVVVPGSATLNVTNATIDVDNTFNGDYPFTTFVLGTGSTVNYDKSGAQTIDSTKTYYNLAISGSSTKLLAGTTNVTGTLTLNAGTFDMAVQSLNVGFIVLNGGTFIAEASTIDLTGTGGTLITVNAGSLSYMTSTFNMTGNGDATLLAGALSFYNLTSSGTGTKRIGTGTAVSIANGGTLSITNGVFDTSTSGANAVGTTTLSVTNATVNVTAATFATNFSGFTTRTLGTGSTVNYDGAGTQTIDNTLPYYNLAISGGPRVVNFPTTGVTTVTNTFTANGSAGNLLSLFSSASGTHWTLAPTGTASASYVNVKDGVCSAGYSTIFETSITNSGNNGSCWVAASTAASVVSHSGGHAAAPVVVPASMNGSLDFTIPSTVTSPIVPLSFNADASTVTGYAVSLDPTFAGAGIQPYSGTGTNVTFTLPNKTGMYTLYVEYFSSTGNHSQAISHTVAYGQSTASPAAFSRTLKVGSQGSDVTALQKLLVADGELTMTGGTTYGYFGQLTLRALETFQVKHGIVSAGAPGYGMFGPKTRAEAGSL